jgi:hypothetical protein
MVHRREVLLLVEVGTRQLDDSVVTTFNRERAYEQLQRGFGSTTPIRLVAGPWKLDIRCY